MSAILDADTMEQRARALARGIKAHIDGQVHLWRQSPVVTRIIMELALEIVAGHCEALRDQLDEEAEEPYPAD